MNEARPPKFLILTVLAIFLFAFTAGAMFFWPKAKISISETTVTEAVKTP